MSIKTLTSLAAGVLAATVSTAGAQTDPVAVRASSAFDGRGRSVSDATVLVQGGKIVSVESGRTRPATYDLRGLTLLPGLIDTHVHLDTHFGKDGRATSQGEAPPQSMLYEAENAYVTLMAGFTTVQSIGSPLDVDMRAAIARGIMPGPRLLTSIRPVNENTGTPEQIRAFIRKVKADGADLVKLFASKSSREGGGQTMTDEQIQAACGEAKAAGLRSWVHAHSPSSVRAATLAGCTTVTHGSQVTDAELKLMQQHGTYFEPNIGLVSQNYLENKSRYFGIGNFNEEGFAFTEKGIPMKREMFKRARRSAGGRPGRGSHRRRRQSARGHHGAPARRLRDEGRRRLQERRPEPVGAARFRPAPHTVTLRLYPRRLNAEPAKPAEKKKAPRRWQVYSHIEHRRKPTTKTRKTRKRHEEIIATEPRRHGGAPTWDSAAPRSGGTARIGSRYDPDRISHRFVSRSDPGRARRPVQQAVPPNPIRRTSVSQCLGGVFPWRDGSATSYGLLRVFRVVCVFRAFVYFVVWLS